MKNEEWRIRGGPHFGTFWVLGPPKVFIFDRFYKVFRHYGNAMRKPSVGNAFLMKFYPFSEFSLQNSQSSTGFIRVFATRFCILQNSVFHWVYKVFRRFGNALRKPPLDNAFWWFRVHFRLLAPKVSTFDRFYKGIRNAFLHLENLWIPVALLSFWTFWKRVAKTL